LVISAKLSKLEMKTNSRKPRTLQVTRPIVFIDLETTGTVVGLDHIVEIGAVKVSPNGKESEFEARVNPEMRIPMEATKVHGITDEDVRDEPTFAEIAPRLAKFLVGADLAGYNLVRFDLPILESEYRRVRMPLTLKNRGVVDVKTIFFLKEPRDLRAAYRFYCGKESNRSHSAAGDARVCWEVLRGQLEKYPDLPNTPEDISALLAKLSAAKTLDTSGWFETRHGEPAFARGKHHGIPVRDVAAKDPDYLEWMLDAGLSKDTIRVIRTVLPNYGK
jgi:DNA polymerase-3 subunit epsilon